MKRPDDEPPVVAAPPSEDTGNCPPPTDPIEETKHPTDCDCSDCACDSTNGAHNSNKVIATAILNLIP